MISTRNSMFMVLMIIVALEINNCIGDDNLELIPQCTNSTDCPSNEDCFRSECIYPCKISPCPLGYKCPDNQYFPQCKCIVKKREDLHFYCRHICVNEDDCDFEKKCLAIFDQNHHCYCPRGFTVNSEIGECVAEPICLNDDDCAPSFLCELSRCVSVCKNVNCFDKSRTCGIGDHNEPICKCKSGYLLNYATNTCESLLEAEQDSIITPEPRVCEDSECGENEECQDVNGFGNRECQCKYGFYKRSFERNCRKKCEKNADCDLRYEVCSYERCVKVIWAHSDSTAFVDAFI